MIKNLKPMVVILAAMLVVVAIIVTWAIAEAVQEEVQEEAPHYVTRSITVTYGYPCAQVVDVLDRAFEERQSSGARLPWPDYVQRAYLELDPSMSRGDFDDLLERCQIRIN